MQLGNRSNQMRFSQAPSVNIQRSQFDRSFTVKDTIDFDYLSPIFIDEVLPGDTANVTLSMFARLATQLVPIMDNMTIDYFFFFVPNRLVWDNWEKFNGAQDNPGDSTDFIIPQVTPPSGGHIIGSIADKYGIPTKVPNLTVNALPFRAYNLIWNQWFRDQNLQQSLPVPTDDGPDGFSNYQLRKRAKRHDYFTSALPFLQKGPAVSLPIGGTAPVYGNGLPIQLLNNVGGTDYPGNLTQYVTGDPSVTSLQVNWQDTPGQNAGEMYFSTQVESGPIGLQSFAGLTADLNAATSATINALREAFAMQSLFELDAQSGTRYVEILQAHFNVTSPDFRLQRAEYLGGGSSTVNSQPVANTTQTPETPQATLAAYGTSSSQGTIGFTKSFVEHGYVIGMACPRADITYQQGLNKLWSRKTRFDFFWPKLQDLGEQAVLQQEIYATGDSQDELVFGYQERYAEYRYKPSEIHGKFRSTDPTPLDQWHLAEEFGSAPALNATFIEQNTPIQRAIAVTDEPHFLFDGWFTYKHARPMAVRSIPAHLGRF